MELNAILELNAYIQDIELKNEQLVQHAKSQQALIEQLQDCLIRETDKKMKKAKKMNANSIARKAFYDAHKNDTNILDDLKNKLQKAGLDNDVIPWQLVRQCTDKMFDQI